MASPADVAFIRDGRARSIELVRAACERFASRPCLGDREIDPRSTQPMRYLPRFRTTSYGELWRRVATLASGWTRRGLVRPGARVGICGFASVDWVVADLACLYVGATSVPLAANMPAAELAHIACETELTAVFASNEQREVVTALVAHCPAIRTIITMDLADVREAPKLSSTAASVHTIGELEAFGAEGPIVPVAGPAHDLPADPIVTILYTSGSTGAPKGVVFNESRWNKVLLNALAQSSMPLVTVGYLPLAHMAGHHALYHLLVLGGTTYFVPKSDMSTLFEDFQLVRPTVLTLIPRVSGILYQHFQELLAKRGGTVADGLESPLAVAVMAELRATLLGDRLCAIKTGAARTPREVLDFLERCFQVPVLNTYGSTEMGDVAVTINDRVQPGIEYRLEDVPELGYRTTDKPYPRGELLVRVPRTAYFGNTATGGSSSDGGYVRSGDIVEQRGRDHLVWIDRKHDVLKLAQGEFVSLSRLEDVYATHSPLIDQIFVYGTSERTHLVAVIVPRADGTETVSSAQLRQELDRAAKAHGLQPHEVPRDFIVESRRFSRENQLLTDANKPNRVRLNEAYGSRLARLYADIEARQHRSPGGPAPSTRIADEVYRALTATLGIEVDASQAHVGFIGLGGDSFGAVRLCALLEEACGVTIGAEDVLDPELTIAGLVQVVESLCEPSEQAGRIADEVYRALTATLGIEVDASQAHVGFIGLGGDSFGAVRLCALLEEACGVTIGAEDVLDPELTIAGLVEVVEKLHVPSERAGAAPRAGSSASLDAAALERLIERAVEQDTDALVVVHEGQVVCERWLKGAPRRIAARSLTKSVVSLALGRLLTTGAIRSFDEPVHAYFPEWRQGRKRLVTLRHLAAQTSGLQERPSGAELEGCRDLVQLALCAELDEEPGQKFAYNNKATNLLAGIVQRVGGRPLDDFLRDEIFSPLGIRDFAWTRDDAGTPHAMSGLELRPADLAKLAQLMLDDGRVDGRVLLDRRWIAEMTTAGPRTPCYGLLWWIIKQVPVDHPDSALRGRLYYGELLDTVERGLTHDAPQSQLVSVGYRGDGRQGQQMIVLPQERLVIVRMRDTGARPDTEAENVRHGFPDLVELARRLVVATR